MATIAEMIEAATMGFGAYQATKEVEQTKVVDDKKDTTNTIKIVLIVTATTIVLLTICFFALRKK